MRTRTKKTRKQRIKEELQEILAGVLIAIIPLSMFMYWLFIGY